jgi:alkyl hydroperoxide reductase subunit F
VNKQGDLFKIETDDGKNYSAKTLILATGKRHRPLNVPGEKELSGKGVAYCATCDAPFFKDRKVVVAGGGNSAFTSARDLLKVHADVTVINASEGWQGDPALMEKVKAMGRVTFLDNHRILRIEGGDRVEAVFVRDGRTGAETRLEAGGVFVEIGWVPNTGPVRDLALLSDRQELRIDCSSATSVPGLFGAGDVTTVPHKQIIISAGEGAKAALSAYGYLAEKSFI